MLLTLGLPTRVSVPSLQFGPPELQQAEEVGSGENHAPSNQAARVAGSIRS